MPEERQGIGEDSARECRRRCGCRTGSQAQRQKKGHIMRPKNHSEIKSVFRREREEAPLPPVQRYGSFCAFGAPAEFQENALDCP